MAPHKSVRNEITSCLPSRRKMITSFLPDFGQDSCVPSPRRARSWVVATPYRDLVDHLTRTTTLSLGEAARVVDDVLTYFAEPADAYVRRRHGELRYRGLTNDEIFQRIAAELPAR